VRRSLVFWRSLDMDARPFASDSTFLESGPPHSPTCQVLAVRLLGQSGLHLQRELCGGGAQDAPDHLYHRARRLPMTVQAMKGGFKGHARPAQPGRATSQVSGHLAWIGRTFLPVRTQRVFLEFLAGQPPSRQAPGHAGASTPLQSNSNAAHVISFRGDGYRLSIACGVHHQIR
jgi:hypothetical protein